MPDSDKLMDTLIPVPPEKADTRALMPPLSIALVPLTALAALFFVRPVLAPALMETAGMPPEAYGWIGGALGLGSVSFFLTSHAITPVLGPLGTLRFGLFVSMIGAVLILMESWPLMIVGAGLIGIGYGTTTPTGSQILADFTPKSTWGTLFSLRQAGVPAGGVLAAAVAAATLTDYGWTTALTIILGIVIVTALGLVSAPERYNLSRPLKPFILSHVFDPQNLVRPIRAVRAVPGLTSLVAAGCGLSMAHGAVTQFFVLYLSHGLGMSLAVAALLFGVMQICAIAGRIFLGAIADKIGSPLTVLRFLAPLSACASLLLSYFSADWQFPAQLAAAIAIGLTVGTWNGLYLAEIARLAPAAEVSSATASSAVFTFASYMITPPLVGLLAVNFGWRATFEIIALAPLIAGFILAWRHWSEAIKKKLRSVIAFLSRHSSSGAARGDGLPNSSAVQSRTLAAFCAGLVIALAGQQLAGVGRASLDARPGEPPVALSQPRTTTSIAQEETANVKPSPVVSALVTADTRSPLGRTAEGVTREEGLMLADKFLRGVDSPRNRLEAAYWLKHALSPTLRDPALPWALSQLGSVYAAPDAGLPDYKSASTLWQIAASLGDPVAHCFLARLHEFGLGVEKDPETARRLYALALNAGGCPGLARALGRLQ